VIDRNKLSRLFMEVYGDSSPPRLFRAPGRVNLIGEHTDYNDGFVLPMAINRETIVAARRRDDRRVRVRSVNINEAAEFDLDTKFNRANGRRLWLNYIEGVARILEERGARLTGADFLIQSDVPEGAGLSSSAALEVSTGLAMLSISNTEVDRVKLALAGQAAEHEYVGAKVGIMDQYIAALAEKQHALLIDCRSLEATTVPVDTSTVSFVICNSRVKHELASSAYNQRRAECERGVELLKNKLPEIRALRDVNASEFEKHEDCLPEIIRRRCRHVITENARTLAAANAFRQSDLQRAGQLMYESHASLDHDYEVSCPELNRLVEIARRVEGVLGARMTGGGFGGCTVNLVENESLDAFREAVTREYYEATDRAPAIYVSEACGGAEEV
jgi:galactokinase